MGCSDFDVVAACHLTFDVYTIFRRRGSRRNVDSGH
jgi:hypothetical protein